MRRETGRAVAPTATLRGTLAEAGAAAVPAAVGSAQGPGHLRSTRRFVGGQGKTKAWQQAGPGSNTQKSAKQAGFRDRRGAAVRPGRAQEGARCLA